MVLGTVTQIFNFSLRKAEVGGSYIVGDHSGLYIAPMVAPGQREILSEKEEGVVTPATPTHRQERGEESKAMGPEEALSPEPTRQEERAVPPVVLRSLLSARPTPLKLSSKVFRC